MWFCCRAEILRGECFQSIAGRDLASLESPCMDFLASSLALLFWAKLMWPGTQCTCRSMMLLVLPFQLPPSAIASSHSTWLISLSCFCEGFLPHCEYNQEYIALDCWLSSILKTAWLSAPRIIEWVSLMFRFLGNEGPSLGPLLLPHRLCTRIQCLDNSEVSSPW